jgi:signal transduction histidine kinase
MPENGVCLYRIVQEALRNVAKHSGAREARVELSGEPGTIRLVVEDAGSGFEPRSARRKGGLGFVSMRERLRLVDGEIAIRSRPGRGTRIEVWAPIPQVGATAWRRRAMEAEETP